MDLNRLYSDHQVSAIRAARATSPDLRRMHEIDASHIAGRIGRLQRGLGASAAVVWERLAAA